MHLPARARSAAQSVVLGALLAAALVLAAAPPAAQTAWVQGTVVDDETGAPLSGAHVFLSGSTTGDAVDRGGRFAFRTDALGRVTVTATMLGYGTAATGQILTGGDTLVVAFRLPPEPVVMGDVEVVRERDEAWERALALFRPAFLGRTANADRTRITNPEVLTLAYDRESGLRAEADAPLVVRNDALGYEITFYDLALDALGEDWMWTGAVVFRDLCDAACAASVLDARQRAYRGSLAHFYDALVRDDLEGEGFSTRRVSEPGRSGRSLSDLFGGGPPGVEAQPVPYGWMVETGGAVRVEYGGERGGRQVSWLTAPLGVLRLGPTAVMLDPAEVVRYGHWDGERVADALPLDYRPPRPDGP